jgi:murein DD-endopeptidase MepM/ murein hydrolase activator NlpD
LIKPLFVFASIENSIEIPLSKPDEKYWRLKSEIEIPEKKPDPIIFMLALPSDVKPPLKKPDPKSIFPLATRSLTEMVFKKTNIATKSENLISLSLRKNEGINPLLRRAGFNASQAYQAVLEIENKINLNKLPIGLEVKILSPKDSNTSAFSFKLNNKFNLYAILDKNFSWTSFKAIRPVKKETLLISGEIKSNLYLSAQEVSLPEDTLMEFVQLMGYSVDFQRQIQKGDTFKILFNQSFDVLDNRRIGLEKISYAELNVSGESFKFFRYLGNEGNFGYYDLDGQSARKALMRTPINGARLSSGFGMRKHPIKGFSAMHKGVDFGAPSGTPIFAAGDGVLEKVGWVNGYGRYILIRHNSTYKTAYAHMRGWAKGIRRGAKVYQGQVIGYVGSSGNSTGPHLHYEILINGQQTNPLNVKMPSGKPINKNEMHKFLKEIENILNKVINLEKEN